MTNWLYQFWKLFPEASLRVAGREQDLSDIERAVQPARTSRQVDAATLQAIEKSAVWNYEWYWPRLSSALDAPVALPLGLESSIERQRAVQDLHERLHHIEVVSILLRFIEPNHFGIISPPVLAILNLAPVGDAVSQYMKYIEVLADLGRHYGLQRVADVDMGLWSAAHLRFQEDFAAIAEQMYLDEHFQEVILGNLLGGIGRLLRGGESQRLVLARAVVSQDYLLAALVAARIYEAVILDLGQRWGIDPGVRKRDQTKAGALVDKLGRSRQMVAIGFTAGDLRRWWEWRNDSVHPERQISRAKAERFVTELSRFCTAVSVSPSSADVPPGREGVRSHRVART